MGSDGMNNPPPHQLQLTCSLRQLLHVACRLVIWDRKTTRAFDWGPSRPQAIDPRFPNEHP